MLTALSLVLGATVTVDAALLHGLAPAEAVLTAHGESHVCTGPLLADVVTRMGAPSGQALRGSALRTTVTAVARDGYAVVFSLGEIDPLLGNNGAIVAMRCNGAAIAESDGPFRLVLPGERRAARSVRQLDSLTITYVGEQP